MGLMSARRKTASHLALPLLVTLYTASQSPTALALSEDDFIADLPVVLSASRLAQPKSDAPVAITVIDRSMIEASTAIDIPELLQLVPGFQVGRVSGLVRSVTSHGLSDQFSRRMQILVDGRSVYDPVFGGMIWESIPLSIHDVERIEVVRGPNAASYGANAFLGAINIVTRQPGVGDRQRVRVLAGSLGTRQLDLAGDWLFGQGHSFQLSLGTTRTDGFQVLHDGGQLNRLNARLGLRLTPRDTLDLSVGASRSRLQAGFPEDEVQPERSVSLNYGYQQLQYQHRLDDGSDLSFQLYHNRQQRTDRFDVVFDPHWPVVPTFLDSGFVAERYDAELEWRTAFGDATRLVLGAGWRQDSGKAPHGLDSTVDSAYRQFRLFAHGEHRLSDQLLIQAGAMAEYFEDVGGFLSPRLSANYRLSEQHTLRISAARGYRLPALLEHHANFGLFSSVDDSPVLITYRSAADVQPEVIDAFEIGLVGSLRPRKLDYDIKLFHHRLRDLIDTERHTDIQQYIFNNIGRMDIRGLELQLSAALSPRTRLRASYSHARGRGSSDKYYNGGVLIGTRSLDKEVPRNTLALLLSHDFTGDLQASATFFHVSDQVWAGDGGENPAYDRLDLKLSKRLRLSHRTDMNVELILSNVLNSRYNDFIEPDDEHPGNVAERQALIQLKLDSF